MATNTARHKSKSNLLPGSVPDESVSSTNVPLPSVHILPGESKKIQGPL